MLSVHTTTDPNYSSLTSPSAVDGSPADLFALTPFFPTSDSVDGSIPLPVVPGPLHLPQDKILSPIPTSPYYKSDNQSNGINVKTASKGSSTRSGVRGKSREKKSAQRAREQEEEDDSPIASPSAVADAFGHLGFTHLDEGRKINEGPLSPSTSEFDPNLCSPSAVAQQSLAQGFMMTMDPAHLQQHAMERSTELAAAKEKTSQGKKGEDGQQEALVSRFPTKILEYKESEDGRLTVPSEMITAIHSFPARITNKLDFATMRQFLTAPLPPNLLFQCIFIRNRSGLKNRIYPRYELYFESTKTFLLSSKKKTQNKTSNYVISMSKKNVNNHSVEYLGKVRGNFSGSEYICYDDGLNPKYVAGKSFVGSAPGASRTNSVREEIGAVFYSNNILGSTPRKLQAVIPTVTVVRQAKVIQPEAEASNGNSKEGEINLKTPASDAILPSAGPQIEPSIMRRASWADLSKRSSIVSRYKTLQSAFDSDRSNPNMDDEMMTCLLNKVPGWNKQLGAFALNFAGRAKIPSVKNFQLIKPTEPTHVMMQFGKMDKDVFTLDIQHPLSPLQAFAFALSGVDSKLVSD